jgi:hypothetical protein
VAISQHGTSVLFTSHPQDGLVVNFYIPHNRRTPLQAEEALGPISIPRGFIPFAEVGIHVYAMLCMNPGRFAPITCSPRVDSPWVVSPRKVSRFAPLNRYYIMKVFFDYFLEIIYLLVVCKKYNNSFILVYFKYLFISCTYKKKKKFIHFGLFLSKISSETFLAKFTKTTHKNSQKVGFFFCTKQKCMK